MKILKIISILLIVLVVGYLIPKIFIPTHLENLSSSDYDCAIIMAYTNLDHPLQRLGTTHMVVEKTEIQGLQDLRTAAF